MSAIPDEVIEQVRDSADLVHLLGEHVDLKRTGADYRGPCPFHGGTKRNFAVIPRKQMFYCFVCHEGGDVFTFFMKRFGMDYPTAVRDVAAKVGVVIPDRPTGGPDPREPLYSAVAVAAEWYAKQLREGPQGEIARKYLAGRGFSGEALHPLGLGFAPKGNAFLEAMKTFGIAPDALFDAGLLVRRDDESLRPRFWGRLLFPIHDLRGRVVGFGGRVLDDGEPKYLNSPDSRIFHKGQLLYNLHHARSAIRRAEKAIVVEGYFDVLRAVAAGVEHVVAPLGTACTADQAALLKRYTTDVVVRSDAVPEPDGQPPHILIVDDDPEDRLLVRTILEKHGFRVSEATDGDEALDMIADGTGFSLVVLDLEMPNVDGRDVLARLRNSGATVALPVVVLTGSADPEDEYRLMESGADDYLKKPIDPPRFMARVKAALRRARTA